MKGEATKETMLRGQTEAAFQAKIAETCDLLGLAWHHETDSRRSKPGFPDLCIVGNRVIFLELKTERGIVSKEQQAWIDRINASTGGWARVVRPSDWDLIYKLLVKIAGRR